MNDHEAPEPAGAKVVEVKVIGMTLVGLLCSIVFAVLNAVAATPHILDSFPEWSRFVILAAIPPILMFLTGYAIPSNRV